MSAKIKHMSLQDKAFEALKEAVREVVREHKRTGRPLAVWQNGKAVLISPNTVK
jgi:NCAIR mutase (PurE)-related protein